MTAGVPLADFLVNGVGGGGGGGGTITQITGSGLVTVTGGTGPVANANVDSPNFTAGSNMTITGTWPNITFSSSGGGGGSSSAVTALTISANSINVDCSLGDYFTLSMSDNILVFAFSNLPVAGFAKTIMVQITQNASSAKTLVFPSSFKWPGGSANIISTALSTRDLLAISTFDQGTSWNANMVNNYA